MSEPRVDLYLGGDLAPWVLQRVHPEQIATVITPDPAVHEQAKARGFTARHDSPQHTGIIALSVHFPKILPASVLKQYRAAYNLHPGFLPWGRGYYPAFWALLDGTPAGATLHLMTERLDAGPIVEQIRVHYTDADTGGSLHRRIREAEMQLFDQYWPKIAAGDVLPARPQQGAGSYHARAEFFAMKRPENWQKLEAEQLVRRIRCLTFPGYTGLELPLGERVMQVSMQEVN